MTIYLYNENGTQLSTPIQPLTDENGIAAFEFNSDPPYGDVDEWGEVYFEILVDDPRLSDQSRADFDALAADSPWAPDYQYAEVTEPVPTWVYILALLIAAGAAAGTVLYRRKKSQELLEEAAEIFAYTAELLAAGDSIREAIFTCYQSLCAAFQEHGFLRRDFETVREFEMAIRQAMPQISDEALVALDNCLRASKVQQGGTWFSTPSRCPASFGANGTRDRNADQGSSTLIETKSRRDSGRGSTSGGLSSPAKVQAPVDVVGTDVFA